MTQREVFVGSLNLWASKSEFLGMTKTSGINRSNSFPVFGALGSTYVTDRYGRRKAFVVAAVLFIVGCIIQTMTGTYSVLMFGRVFVGLGVGFGLALDVSTSMIIFLTARTMFLHYLPLAAYLHCRNHSCKTPW